MHSRHAHHQAGRYTTLPDATRQTAASPHTHADVSEFRLRMLMQRSASPFAIINAVGDTWLSTGPALASGFRIVRLAKLLDG
jgi:hypothetical protein